MAGGTDAARRAGQPPSPTAPLCCPPSRARSEELNQPLFAAIDAFEFPELHDESIAARNFYRHLAKLMVECGVKDFGMKARAELVLSSTRAAGHGSSVQPLRQQQLQPFA